MMIASSRALGFSFYATDIGLQTTRKPASLAASGVFFSLRWFAARYTILSDVKTLRVGLARVF
jgi:hypothetical protein